MHHLDSALGALEVKFGPLPMQTWLDVKFDSTQFQKKIAQFRVRIAKLCPFYRTTSELGFQSCGTDSDEKSGEATTMQTSQ
jgi:hypothetical protein